MNKNFISGLVAVYSFFSAISISAAVFAEGIGRNIAIEVEFKETGNSGSGLGGFGPYETRNSFQYTKQFIVVSDGLSGSIRIGEDVPFVEFYNRYLCDLGYIESAEVSFKELGTKLEVSPKIRGEYVEITLTPQITYISKGVKDVIKVEELSTTVMARDGESISIGGLIKDDEFGRYFFKNSNSVNLNIVLTPRIK